MCKCQKVRKDMVHWTLSWERTICGRMVQYDVNASNILEAMLRMFNSIQKARGSQGLVLNWVSLPSA